MLGLAFLVVVGSDAATWSRPAVEGLYGTPEPWMPGALAGVIASENYGWLLLGSRVAAVAVLIVSLVRPHRMRWLAVLALGTWMGFAESTQTGLTYWESCPRLIAALGMFLSAGWVAPGQRRDRRVTFVQMQSLATALVAALVLAPMDCGSALVMEEVLALPWDRGAFVRPTGEVIEIFVGLGTVLMMAAILSARPYGLVVARNLTLGLGVVWCLRTREISLFDGTRSSDAIWSALVFYGIAILIWHLL
jgi:hypothetical protein